MGILLIELFYIVIIECNIFIVNLLQVQTILCYIGLLECPLRFASQLKKKITLTGHEVLSKDG